MRRWAYMEPDWSHPDTLPPLMFVFTEDEIMEQYFQYWSKAMVKIGNAHLISRERCIEDWVVVHWAWEVTDG